MNEAPMEPAAVAANRFTDGPWKYGHLGTEAFWVGPDYDQAPVAIVEHDTDTARYNSRDNARALSALPELVKALEVTLDRLEDASNLYHNSQQWHAEDAPDGSGMTLREWVEAPAVAALAKTRSA